MMWFIPKNRKSILSLTAGLCLSLGFGFIAGCKESAPTDKPTVVKKRIEQTSQTKQTKVTETEKTAPKAETAGPKPTATPETVAATADSATTAAPETATPKAEKALAPDEKTAPAQAPEAAQEKAATPQPETAPSEAAAVPEAQTGEGALGETTAETESVSLKDSLLDNTFPKYDPTGKIDPFAALFSKESEKALSDDTEPKRPLTPLEKIDISQLKLSAIIQSKSGNLAMVEDATGKPYILTTGTYVGINSGTVTKILDDRVVIEEKTKDFLGRKKANTRELKIQKPFGEE